MQAPGPSPPSALAIGQWRCRALEVLPAASLLVAAPLAPLLWGALPRTPFVSAWLGPFAGGTFFGWDPKNQGFALRCVPVALASLAYPAIAFWIWPRSTERAGGMQAIAPAAGALL
jgi:hypothetical protein